MKLYSLVLAALLLSASCGGQKQAEVAAPPAIADSAAAEELARPSPGIELGQPIPDATAFLPNGEEASLSELIKGRTLLIVFDPECSHCVTAGAKLKVALRDDPIEDLRVISFCTGLEAQTCQGFSNMFGLPDWIKLSDTQKQSNIREVLKIGITPQLVLTDPQGYVVLDTDDADALLAELYP